MERKREKKRETGAVPPEPLIYTLIYIDLVSLWGYLCVYVCMGVYIMCILSL
jgi:hypothetical protein